MSNWQQTGDGAVQISIEDAAKWDENFYHPRVGGQRLIDELQTPGHLANGKRLNYARGLFVGNYRGLRLVSHGGAWIGYRAAFDRYPSVHTSIVVFCNSDAASPETLAQRVADIVLKPYLGPNSAGVAPNTKGGAVSAQALTGAYFDEAGGDVFHVMTRGTRVFLNAGGNAYALTPAGGSSFRLGSTTVTFAVKNGSATALKLDGGGEEGVYAVRFTPVLPSAAQLDGATASYYSPELDVTWRLRTDAHSLWLEPARYLPDGAAGKLHPQLPDAFTSDGGFLIRLTRNSAGAITGFTLSAGRGLRSLEFTRLR
jgi:hypothetical protein